MINIQVLANMCVFKNFWIFEIVFLPKCWATSKISLGDLPSTSKAFKIGGKLLSNWTSTTAPITETTRPLLKATCLAAAACDAALRPNN